ncbi:MAG: hypothetical protein AB8B92_06590 [Gammaproteobacteria bacterium]
MKTLLATFLLIFTSSSCAEGDSVERIVSNANEQLPMMIDEELRMEKILLDKKKNNYTMTSTFVNYELSELDLYAWDDEIGSTIVTDTCADDSLDLVFKEGYTVNIINKDKSGELIRSYTISPGDCK